MIGLTLAPALEPQGLEAARDFLWDKGKHSTAAVAAPPALSDERRQVDTAFRQLLVAFEQLYVRVEVLEAHVTGEWRAAPEALFEVASSPASPRNILAAAADLFDSSESMTAAERAEFRAMNREFARPAAPVHTKRRSF